MCFVLLLLLLQVGAWVPADSLELTPVDAIFVRMGAKDSIMTGQSTFFVELSETAAMLHRATPSSLVILDELGRGTATLDGAAIASAVLQHLAHVVGCRGLFATHYHHLASEHEVDSKVAIMHMACAVSGGAGDEEEAMEVDGAVGAGGGSGAAASAPADRGDAAVDLPDVTFLYQLAPGACPKSYGTNVARLAGLPAAVVSRAAAVSQEKLSGAAVSGVLAPALAAAPGAAVAHLLGRAVQAIKAAAQDGADSGGAAVVAALKEAQTAVVAATFP